MASQTTDCARPKPFVKWAGGKRQLMPLLLSHCPPREQIDLYVEPFLGGGALLFALKPEYAWAGDINSELINTYRVIREQLDTLLASLAQHPHTAEYFYSLRAKAPDTLDAVSRASRFLYLNRTCFNGLYRENARGQFNVPFGRYRNPNIVNEITLRAVNRYLNAAEISLVDGAYVHALSHLLSDCFPGDPSRTLVYLDPPYHPISITASFTQYSKTNFTVQDQTTLAEKFRQLDARGYRVLLSNSNTALIRELYAGFEMLEVCAARAINAQADGRAKAPLELLVKNF